VHAPTVETLCESSGLLAFGGEKQFSRFLGLFDSQVLDVNLRRFVGELDLHFGTAGAEPQKYLLAVVENHYIVVREIVLAKIGTLFADNEVAFLVRASK